ncbi:MAG: hypothetical protein IT381_08640 [Deltaproteobacteria bacterium]|nr:hypothetical protein [Deltaproteobacteria bacterium]
MRALLLLLVACSSTPTPEDPVWNKQPCDHCKMIVSDKRYAASLLDDRGQRRYFDDVGCLAEFDQAGRPARARWVRDEASGKWISAEAAHYRKGAATPMDFGYSAHAEPPGISYGALKEALAARRGALQ